MVNILVARGKAGIALGSISFEAYSDLRIIGATL
jgi:hypothetical protein